MINALRKVSCIRSVTGQPRPLFAGKSKNRFIVQLSLCSFIHQWLITFSIHELWFSINVVCCALTSQAVKGRWAERLARKKKTRHFASEAVFTENNCSDESLTPQPTTSRSTAAQKGFRSLQSEKRNCIFDGFTEFWISTLVPPALSCSLLWQNSVYWVAISIV